MVSNQGTRCAHSGGSGYTGGYVQCSRSGNEGAVNGSSGYENQGSCAAANGSEHRLVQTGSTAIVATTTDGYCGYNH